MERDFLGVVGRNSMALAAEESLGSRLDSISSVVHRPFQNKVSALQNLMSFKASGEDKRKKLLFEPLSSTGTQPPASIDAFQANNTACAVKAPERLLNMEGHGFTQFSISQNQTTDTHLASTRRYNDAGFAAMSHSTIAIAKTSPFLKSHVSSNGPIPTATAVKQPPFGSLISSNPFLVTNGVGSFTPRNAPKPRVKNAQLTIFYAGSVHVYDDVPLHMAHAIMLLASKECKTAGHTRSETSVLPSLSKGMVSDGLNVITQTLNNTTNQVQNSCSQMKTASEPQPSDDKTGAKSLGDLILTSKNECANTMNTCMGSATSDSIIPRALPQARKASLARFLEKRKERISSMIPYSCEKKSPDGSFVLEGAPSSKSSSPNASNSSNRCGSRYVGQTKS